MKRDILPRWIVLMGILPLLIIAYGCAPVAETPTTEIPPDESSQPALSKDGVAILVIDDFLSGSADAPQMIKDFFPSDLEFCVATPAGQAHSTIRGVAVQNGAIPHGELVLNDIVISFRQSGTFLDSRRLPNSNEDIHYIQEISTTEGLYYLVAIDTQGFTSKVIGDRMTSAIKYLSGQEISKYVVNMSFALIPCDPIYGLRTSDDPTGSLNFLYTTTWGASYPDQTPPVDTNTLLDDLHELKYGASTAPFRLNPVFSEYWVNSAYMDLLNNVSDGVTPVEINTWKNYETTLLAAQLDPLHDAIQTLRNDSMISIVFVAAAGNFGQYHFPFAPAIWSEVLSVGAIPYSSDLTRGETFISNPGEIQMDPVYAGNPAEAPQTNYFSIKPFGTSFSAPKLSQRIAAYLARGGSTSCFAADPQVHTFKYAPFFEWWQNYDLDYAIQNFCPEF